MKTATTDRVQNREATAPLGQRNRPNPLARTPVRVPHPRDVIAMTAGLARMRLPIRAVTTWTHNRPNTLKTTSNRAPTRIWARKVASTLSAINLVAAQVVNPTPP